MKLLFIATFLIYTSAYSAVYEGLWEMNDCCDSLSRISDQKLFKAQNICSDNNIYSDKTNLYLAINQILNELDFYISSTNDHTALDQITALKNNFEEVQLILLNDDDH